jgi:predicted RND superfamily exporter protein
MMDERMGVIRALRLGPFSYLWSLGGGTVEEEGLTLSKVLRAALVEGSCMRGRPVLMTVFTTLLGLLPLMFATGTGAHIMKRLVTPMVGGLFSAALMTLVMLPSAYMLIQGGRYREHLRAGGNGRLQVHPLPEEEQQVGMT